MKIKDSGERTAYSTGAVRDCKAGKGKCTLLPLDICNQILEKTENNYHGALYCFHKFKQFGSCDWLSEAIESFASDYNISTPELVLEAAHQFEDGAEKYGEDNWQKGIPVSSYVDSAIRHYLKYRAGWRDEPHDRAFVWNVICCYWTMIYHPELDDYTDAAYLNKGETENDRDK